MRLGIITTITLGVALCGIAPAGPARAWTATPVDTGGPVKSIDKSGGGARIETAAGWFSATASGGKISLTAAAAPASPPLPPGALPDGRAAGGNNNFAQAWLMDPTGRYKHGALGDTLEAGGLDVMKRDGTRLQLRLGSDAVFEDLSPRIADLGNDGDDKIVVVKSYLARGSALAVAGERNGRLEILAETPPIGHSNRWLNPAGIADFDGDGSIDIAFVMMPHAVGRLELWSWRKDKLQKIAEVEDTTNHSFGSHVLGKSAVADFDGDGVADLAIPSFDGRAIRLLAFKPKVREIARVRLPARVTTELAVVRRETGPPVVIVGVEGGKLLAIGN